jgi:hypothetical protein
MREIPYQRRGLSWPCVVDDMTLSAQPFNQLATWMRFQAATALCSTARQLNDRRSR